MEKMKVLLISGDVGKGLLKPWPNIALMKLSALHKRQGDKIYFNRCKNPDRVYISCIFTQNREKALSASRFYPNAEIFFGGTGFNLSTDLPPEAEHIMPDYDLYGIDYSMGFSSRGCIRNCPWCIVPRKEGYIHEHSPLEEFIDPRHNKVLLLDPNFTASPLCNEKLRYFIEKGLKVSFNQGLDIRLIDEEKATLFKEVNYRDSDFNERRLYFSFDLPEIKPAVEKGIRLLEEAGIPSKHLMFYVLCGYNSSHEQDYERFEILANVLDVDPYIMVYNHRRDDKWLNLFSSWVNERLYKKGHSLEDFLLTKGHPEILKKSGRGRRTSSRQKRLV